MAKHLTTVDQVLGEFGGYIGMAKLLGCDRRRTHNWKQAGRFPASTFLMLTEALRQRGKTASPDLWALSSRRLKAS